MREALDFLAALQKHNDRTWFAARKERYRERVLEPLQRFVAELSERCEQRGIPLYGDARRSVFRIYRDLRFTPDKRPFKTHAAAYLSRDGGRATPGGFYIRIDPEGSYFSAAFFMPPDPLLRRWRAAMAEDPAAFSRVVRALERKRLRIRPPQEWDDALRRMPRGFEALAAAPLAPYFRLRSFAVRRSLATRDVGSSRLVERALAFIEAAGPLLRDGWRLADDVES
jgi:uncharacterized protein (TIGR02453 family)